MFWSGNGWVPHFNHPPGGPIVASAAANPPLAWWGEAGGEWPVGVGGRADHTDGLDHTPGHIRLAPTAVPAPSQEAERARLFRYRAVMRGVAMLAA